MTPPDPKQIAQEIADELLLSKSPHRAKYVACMSGVGWQLNSWNKKRLVDLITGILNRRLK